MVSFKTVSKWECGKGLPEVSLFIPLCEILEISVNELLDGCHISKEDYMKKAEEKLLDNALNERSRNRRMIIAESILVFSIIIQMVIIVLMVGQLEMKDHLRIIIIIITIVTLFAAVFALCFIENDSGYFECKHCNEVFKPTIKEFIIGPHTLTTRQLKCPKCVKTSYCKKRLSK